MAGASLLEMLLVALLLGTAMPQMPLSMKSSPQSYDIKAFMNTTEPIWTYNTTLQSDNIMCKVDKMFNISGIAINFDRSMLYKGNKTGYPVEGTFFPQSAPNPNTILFGAPGGLKEGYEWMIYASENYSCAVMNVTLTLSPVSSFWFDMRVRNSSVKSGPPQKCQDFFKNVAPMSRQFYSASCQKMLNDPILGIIRLPEVK